MKRSTISTTMLLSLASISMTSNAAEIKFTGKVTAASCELSSGNLSMQLPTVGEKYVQDPGQHAGVTSLSAAITCAGATDVGTVTMSLMPNVNTFNGPVLLNTATGEEAAEGVGIVVLDKDNKPIDFSKGSEAVITAPMSESGSANIVVQATYAKDGSGNPVEAGNVAAVLPFVMTYE